MSRARTRPTRKTMAALAVMTLVLGVANTAAAAKPVDPEFSLNEPTATCNEANEVTVRASVNGDVDLTGFNIRVVRWENVTTASPDDFDGFGQVEDWVADFWKRSRKTPDIPMAHTLETTDAATWTHHGWRSDYGGDTSSDLFVVSVNAYAEGKGNAQGTSEWDDWVVDCSGTTPTISEFISPWGDEDAWTHQEGTL